MTPTSAQGLRSALLAIGIALSVSAAHGQSLVTFGGTGTEIAQSLALDGSGNAVVTGFFTGTVDFDPGAGVTNRTSNGGLDAFVARYSAAGTLVSVATFGGADPDGGYSVALDGSGNAVVLGDFTGTVDFDPGAGVTNRTSNGGLDAFVARYTDGGALVSVITFGGADSEASLGVAVDGSGNVVVTGHFTGTVDFDPGAGVTNRTSNGDRDVFVARYTDGGTLVSVATFGGTARDIGAEIALDDSGNAVVTGRFNGTADFDPGAGVTNRTSNGGLDAFVARYSAAGALVSVITFGGAGADFGQYVTVDDSGNAVVTGFFQNAVDFDPGAGVTSHTSSGSEDAYVARYNSSGALVSVITFGGPGSDAGNGVALDGSGNAVVTGFFTGTVDFDPGAGVTTRTSSGTEDAFVARYSAAGTLASVITFGRVEYATGQAVAIGGSGDAVVAGFFTGTVDFDPGAGVTSRTSNGSEDAFVARYTDGGALATGISTPPQEGARPESTVHIEVRGQTLRFAVRESQVVRVALFNALGQRLSVLYDGEASVGQTHSLDVPAGLGSGVYLVRVSGRSFAETARVVVR